MDIIRKKGFKNTVVVFPARVNQDVEKRMRATGINGVLVKPFEAPIVIDLM